MAILIQQIGIYIKEEAAISKAMKEDLNKEDEPKVQKIIGKLKKGK